MIEAGASIPQLITAQELADLLKVPVTWVHHHTRAGSRDPIPCVRLGRYVRFDLNDPALRQWLQDHKAGGSARKARGLKVVG